MKLQFLGCSDTRMSGVARNIFTDATSSVAVFAYDCVLGVKRMAVSAMSFCCILRRRANTTQNVFFGGANSKVVNVDAIPVAAKMINRKSCWNGTMRLFPYVAMHKYQPIFRWYTMVVGWADFLGKCVASVGKSNKARLDVAVRFFSWASSPTAVWTVSRNILPRALFYFSSLPTFNAGGEPYSGTVVGPIQEWRACADA